VSCPRSLSGRPLRSRPPKKITKHLPGSTSRNTSGSMSRLMEL
jgi:hypothetical protein